MPKLLPWILASTAVLLALGVPVAFYRYQYVQAKRFHEVTPNRFYRSGQMTATGFRDIIERFKIRTIINLQHEEPDPFLTDHWLGKGKIPESELCRQLGVRYVLLTPDLLPPDNRLDSIPPAVPDFLKVLDDESNYTPSCFIAKRASSHRPFDSHISNGIPGLDARRSLARVAGKRLWLCHCK